MRSDLCYIDMYIWADRTSKWSWPVLGVIIDVGKQMCAKNDWLYKTFFAHVERAFNSTHSRFWGVVCNIHVITCACHLTFYCSMTNVARFTIRGSICNWCDNSNLENNGLRTMIISFTVSLWEDKLRDGEDGIKITLWWHAKFRLFSSNLIRKIKCVSWLGLINSMNT